MGSFLPCPSPPFVLMSLGCCCRARLARKPCNCQQLGCGRRRLQRCPTAHQPGGNCVRGGRAEGGLHTAACRAARAQKHSSQQSERLLLTRDAFVLACLPLQPRTRGRSRLPQPPTVKRTRQWSWLPSTRRTRKSRRALTRPRALQVRGCMCVLGGRRARAGAAWRAGGSLGREGRPEWRGRQGLATRAGRLCLHLHASQQTHINVGRKGPGAQSACRAVLCSRGARSAAQRQSHNPTASY